MQVRINTSARQVVAALNEISRKQIPFASSKALNESTWDALVAVRKSVPSKVTLRQKGLLRRFRQVRSHKKQWPDLRASVGSLDDFWNLQETGGVKRPTRGRTLAIPTRLVRKTKARKITPKKLPSALFADGRARATPDTFRKVLKRRNRKDPRTILYLRRPRAVVKPTLGATKTVQSEAARVYPEHFRTELAAAIASRRVRAGSFSSEQGRAAYLSKRARILGAG